MSIINHTDANTQQPAWPSTNLLPQGIVTLFPQPEAETRTWLRWRCLDAQTDTGMVVALCGRCRKGFPTSLLGWPTEKPACEKLSQAALVDCTMVRTMFLRCKAMFACL